MKRNKANPSYLASNELYKLIFGENNILSVEAVGTEESVNTITTFDLKDFYKKNFSPSLAQFIIAGDIDQQRVEAALAGINTKWQAKDVTIPLLKAAEAPAKSQIYFVDVPGPSSLLFISDALRSQGQILITILLM